jgi:uncharacterized protein
LLTVPSSWSEAFYILSQHIERIKTKENCVIFLDEFPWMDTRKSDFLSAFEYFWNSWAVKQPKIVIVICGSAASWMIKNIVRNKGGLHNRITRRIRLLPFKLEEVELYLKSRSIILDRYQILQLYMVMGGIPYYLKSVKKGESTAQTIDHACFSKDGILTGEFELLYQSLFENPENHLAIVKALASNGKGMSRNQIIVSMDISSGGRTSTYLEELEESGFISSYVKFDNKQKDTLYRLTDEFSLFYLKFIRGKKQINDGMWQKISLMPTWRSWSGFAYENICLKHIVQIKKALGIAAVHTTSSAWNNVPGKGEQGAQIDLLIDRADHSISVCEMKFSESEFIITKGYSDELKRKLAVFKEKTKTRKTIFLSMITTYGVKVNDYSGMVDNDLSMEILFE